MFRGDDERTVLVADATDQLPDETEPLRRLRRPTQDGQPGPGGERAGRDAVGRVYAAGQPYDVPVGRFDGRRRQWRVRRRVGVHAGQARVRLSRAAVHPQPAGDRDDHRPDSGHKQLSLRVQRHARGGRRQPRVQGRRRHGRFGRPGENVDRHRRLHVAVFAHVQIARSPLTSVAKPSVTDAVVTDIRGTDSDKSDKSEFSIKPRYPFKLNFFFFFRR